MDLREGLVFCKKCLNKKSDLNTCINCSLAGAKPVFAEQCQNFILDEKEKTNTKAIWGTIAIILIIIKIIARFLND